jgi:hypothetical protein
MTLENLKKLEEELDAFGFENWGWKQEIETVDEGRVEVTWNHTFPKREHSMGFSFQSGEWKLDWWDESLEINSDFIHYFYLNLINHLG